MNLRTSEFAVVGRVHYYRFDFRNYALSLKRRIWNIIRSTVNQYIGLQEKVLHDLPGAIPTRSLGQHDRRIPRSKLLSRISSKVGTAIANYLYSDHIAGCSAKGSPTPRSDPAQKRLYHRCRIYTDMNETVLKSQGWYFLSRIDAGPAALSLKSRRQAVFFQVLYCRDNAIFRSLNIDIFSPT